VRVIVDSSTDRGVSDPLAVVRTAETLKAAEVSAKAVEAVTWGNGLKAYPALGSLEELPTVDQTRQFNGNTVLRAQEPRVDAGER
jgi:hypothetical protein